MTNRITFSGIYDKTGKRHRQTPWFLFYVHFLGFIQVRRWEDKKGLHPDKECGTCRTQRDHLVYYIGPWVVIVSVRSVVGSWLREFHAWRTPKSAWCQYDYSDF